MISTKPGPGTGTDNTNRTNAVEEQALTYDYLALGERLQRLMTSASEPRTSLPQQLLSVAYSIIRACECCHPVAGGSGQVAATLANGTTQLEETLLAALRNATTAAPQCLYDNREPRTAEVTDPTPTLNNRTDIVEQPIIRLDIYALGSFRTFINDRLVTTWPSIKSKSVFKYLVANRHNPRSKEMLMDVFWPNATPQAARNNLNVAIHGARKVLAQIQPDCSFIKFSEGNYYLNTAVEIWVDAEEFATHCHRARQFSLHGNLYAAMAEYRAAEALYQGHYFAEDPYSDWLTEQRESLQSNYVALLNALSQHAYAQGEDDACIAACKKLLTLDGCNELAHRRLMRCYQRQGHTPLAVRQFHQCVSTLTRELNLSPSVETIELFRLIRLHQPV